MKNKCRSTGRTPTIGCAALLALLALASSLVMAEPMGNAFTYQGQLTDRGAPASGSYDLTFTLFETDSSITALAGPVTNAAVAVSNGLFTARLDFGGGVFTGEARWLEIGVRTNGGEAFTTLTNRQELTPRPYALYASSAGTAGSASNMLGVLPGGQLAGTYSNAVDLDNPANSFAGNGGGLTNVNAATLGGLGASSFWQLNGNAGTTPGTHFVGTTDNKALELKANNSRTLRLEPNANGAPNLIGGAPVNYVATGHVGSVIAGGGAANYLGSPYTNWIAGNFGFIGGGINHMIGDGTDFATIGGGQLNTIQSVSGGSTISGGYYNTIQSNNSDATIGGGQANTIYSGCSRCTIGGGDGNTINSGSAWATIPGGYENVAGGQGTFAAGSYAKATHNGSFAWGDMSTTAFAASTNNHSWTVRASGGVRFFSNNAMSTGVYLAPGAGTWTSMSDRNSKENFRSVDAKDILLRVAQMPIQTWNYKSQNAAVRHIGPMAQDFAAAFAVGETETGISTVDADGVALAAIQGLNQKVEEQRAENVELKKRLAQLEQIVLRLTAKGD